MSPVYSYTLADIAHLPPIPCGVQKRLITPDGPEQRSWGEVQVVYSVPPTLQVKLNGLVMFSSRIPAQRLNAGVVAASATRNLYLCGCG